MVYDTFSKRLTQEKYKDYILQHQKNVLSGYKWILENLPDVVPEEDKSVIWSKLAIHDLSKYSEDEFDAYAEHFYGRTQGKEDDVDFDYAWLHHIHHNPHHWQYWVIPAHDEKEFKILDMPYQTIIEMICDWWSFSWKENNLYEIFDWYNKHKENKSILLSEKTQEVVESILSLMKSILDKQGEQSDETK